MTAHVVSTPIAWSHLPEVNYRGTISDHYFSLFLTEINQIITILNLFVFISAYHLYLNNKCFFKYKCMHIIAGEIQ